MARDLSHYTEAEQHAARLAWWEVQEGIQRALTIDGVPQGERETLVRCYRSASEIVTGRYLALKKVGV